MRSELLTARRCTFAAVGLLFLHACIVISLIPGWSATYNEPGHIAAGLACWHADAFDVYCVNPPLPRMVSTLPLIARSDIDLSILSLIHVRDHGRIEFDIGKFFATANADSFHAILCQARLAGVFWITLGGYVVWRWSCELFGSIGGLFSLALWTFEPTVTAHAALATADIPAAVTGLTATYAFARSQSSKTSFSVCISGLLLGSALLCKFTLLILIPCWTIIAVLGHFCEPNATREAIGIVLYRLLAVCVIACLVVNAGFGFKGTGTRLRQFNFISKACRVPMKILRGSIIGDLPSPLPVDYLYGLDAQQRDFEGGMASYLRGTLRYQGWWYYYFYAFSVKSPLGHLAIYALAMLRALWARIGITPFIWIPPVAFLAVASCKSGFTNHLRYILPAYPFLIVASAILVYNPAPIRWRPRAIIASLALLCSISSVSWTYPHLLGYFNEPAGGPEQGWRHLESSNVDWGQDWLFLREWLKRHQDKQPVHIGLLDHVNAALYLKVSYPEPHEGARGVVIVDASTLVHEQTWLLAYTPVERIGASIFVFEIDR